MLSQKCQYAIRAIFELAKNHKNGLMKTTEIARAQAIPSRFLEVILSQLKQGGFAGSKRGAQGGYFLTRPPSEITLGDIISFMEGPLGPVHCLSSHGEMNCSLQGNCVFMAFWEKIRKLESEIYFGTTFQNLIDDDERIKNNYVNSYAI